MIEDWFDGECEKKGNEWDLGKRKMKEKDEGLFSSSDEIRVDAKLNFVEEPVEILEREFKKLKRSRIAIVKVRWNSKRGPEFTWERKDQMKLKYPHLFSDILYRVDGDDFCENYVELRFIVINNPFWKNLLPAMLAWVSNRGHVGNQNGNVANENVQENVGNVIVNGNRVGCSYKDFLACNPKEYDGKGGDVVLTRWIEKLESVHNMSGCSIDQKVKYTAGSFVEFCPSHEMQKLESELWNHAMVGAGHVVYTDRFHELARLVPHLVTHESRMIERYVYGLAPQICGMVATTEPKTIHKAVQISGELTDEAVRNGSIKKVKKRGNVGEPSKDKNGKDDNKRTMTVKLLLLLCNRLGHLARDCRSVSRNVNSINARNITVRECYECGSNNYVRPAYPRWNRAQGPGENCPNQVAANNEGRGHGNQGNQARGRAFMLGAEEAHQDPNIMTGTFTLNNHFATTLFDSGVDYSFVSTTFIPLLGLEPNDLGFKYEIEIASGQLVEIDKVIKGCNMEIEGHIFDIDLIPFGHGSFDVIISMDWLSNYKVEIIFHEKVVRKPLPDGKVLRVVEERPEEKARF
ncbi:putative reverse transcriptase domain-containing protein [Tanacetum coccineum]